MQRLHPDRQGEIIAVLNAIECHVEESQGDRVVLHPLANALLAMAAVVHLEARAVTSITRQLDKLHDHVGPPRG